MIDILLVYEESFEQALAAMDQVVVTLPAPPVWIWKLPRWVGSPLLQVYKFVFWRMEHKRLLQAREACVKSLERLFAYDFEQMIRRALVEMCAVLIDTVLGIQEQLGRIIHDFQQIQGFLSNPALDTKHPRSPFRIFLSDTDLVESIFDLHQPDSSSVRKGLLQNGFLDDWQLISQKDLKDRLLTHCQEIFEIEQALDLESLIEIYHRDNRQTLSCMLSMGAVPLLRPNFDIAGEGLSFYAQYYLCANHQRSQIYRELLSQADDWQSLATGEKFVSVCCRVRLMLTESAVQELYDRGQHNLHLLEKDLLEKAQETSTYDGRQQ